MLAGQAAHAVVLPQPKVPEGQGWQAVEVPGMKKWPDPQHRAVPVGVQWPKVPAPQEGEQVSGRTGVRVSPRKLKRAATSAAERARLKILISSM